jgi:hypothetical protein
VRVQACEADRCSSFVECGPTEHANAQRAAAAHARKDEIFGGSAGDVRGKVVAGARQLGGHRQTRP